MPRLSLLGILILCANPLLLRRPGKIQTPTNTHQSLEEFIRTLKAGRKVYHKRALWCERWTRGEVAWRED